MALNIEIVKLYKMKDLTDAVYWEFRKREKLREEYNMKAFIRKLEKIDLFDIHDSARKMVPNDLIVNEKHNPHLKGISLLFPELIPAKIFYLLLKIAY